MFEARDLERFLELATWVAVNKYEWQMLSEKTRWTELFVLTKAQALIVTRGAEGSDIHTREGTISIPAVSVNNVVDPTGCGDAYRAGVLHGLLCNLDWETTGRIASLMGAIKIESRGPQNHRFTRKTFVRRFEQAFGGVAAHRLAPRSRTA
jgi:adenosine kinase